MKTISKEQMKIIEEAYQKHDIDSCNIDCCIFCYMDNKKELNDDIVEEIVSSGSIPSECIKYFTKEEVLEIENFARKNNDNKLRKMVKNILKRK